MNKIIIIGRLTRDPELRFAAGSGTAVVSFTVAVDRQFKNKDGQKETDFINCVQFGKGAENTANYTAKGSLVGVSGRIQTRNYENKEGKKVYVTEVVADEVQFLDKKDKGAGTSSPAPNLDSDPDFGPADISNDIPF